jgi:protein-S-isoprenylcysteine O-methyltransferase Ste14
MNAAVPLFARNDVWSWVFGASYFAWWLTEAWIRGRDWRKASGVKADRGSFVIIMVLVPAAIAAAFMSPYYFPWARIGGPQLALIYAALMLIWGGIAFRLWAVRTLGRFFRTSVLVHDDHELITRGPYRKLRHPSYTGTFITMLGIGLSMGNWMSIVLSMALTMIAFGRRIAVEEQALGTRFGEAYDVRKRHTWAVIPFVW